MLPSSRVIEAVEKLNFQVTSADVSAQTGLALQVANREVAALASLTGGHMQVTQTGEIAYKFDPNLRSILLQKSTAAWWREFWGKVWRVIFYLIRISFGIVLIISIVLVVIAIFVALAVLSSSSDRDNGSEDRRGGGISLLWIDPTPIFYFSDDYDRPRRTLPEKKAEGDRGFLENVFAFLFGDGNPNYDLEERRYRLIANVIRNHDGVVVGEQLLPYLDEVSPAQLDNEDYMLPVLAKFNGYPEVTPQGKLVYRFPDLQMVASRRPKQDVPKYLEERLWRFNSAGDGANALSAGLGVFYLLASLFLAELLRDPRLASHLTGGFLGFINGVFGFLLGYAILFLLIPTVRYFVIQMWNNSIRQRNALREKWGRALRNLTPDLQAKLAFAQELAIKQSAVDEQRLAYSTESDLLLQEFEALLREPDLQN
ncbi:MAG: hypothetical protein ACK4QL_11000 [Pseudanabaenaceae cyanobacterium]